MTKDGRLSCLCCCYHCRGQHCPCLHLARLNNSQHPVELCYFPSLPRLPHSGHGQRLSEHRSSLTCSLQSAVCSLMPGHLVLNPGVLQPQGRAGSLQAWAGTQQPKWTRGETPRIGPGPGKARLGQAPQALPGWPLMALTRSWQMRSSGVINHKPGQSLGGTRAGLQLAPTCLCLHGVMGEAGRHCSSLRAQHVAAACSSHGGGCSQAC